MMIRVFVFFARDSFVCILDWKSSLSVTPSPEYFELEPTLLFSLAS